MENMKIVKFLEDSGLLSKGVSETIQNEGKEQKRGILSMLLGILGASLLGNTLTSNEIIRSGYGCKDFQFKKRKGIIRAGYGSKKRVFNITPFFN